MTCSVPRCECELGHKGYHRDARNRLLTGAGEYVNEVYCTCYVPPTTPDGMVCEVHRPTVKFCPHGHPESFPCPRCFAARHRYQGGGVSHDAVDIERVTPQGVFYARCTCGAGWQALWPGQARIERDYHIAWNHAAALHSVDEGEET